jgi:hypothetical protein
MPRTESRSPKRVLCWLQVKGRVHSGSEIIEPGTIEKTPEIVTAIREAFRLAGLGLGSKLIWNFRFHNCGKFLMDSSTERLYLAELKLYRRQMGDRYRDSARCSVVEILR